MTPILGSLLLVVVFAAPTLARKVQLALDYTGIPCWSYVMDYNSDCIITEGGSQSSSKTKVVCSMTARPLLQRRGNRLEFSMDSIRIKSQLYNPIQQGEIVRKLTGASFSLALMGGCPVVDTLSSFSVSELSEWDLVIQFAKLLPFVPARPVRKGYSWEESAVYPLMTNMGKVPCEVYRLYRIDSLTAKDRYVHISWKFTYKAIARAMPDSLVLRSVPVGGKGTGTAIVDLEMKSLQKAIVEFQTPIAEYGEIKVVWVEKTTLQALPDTYCAPVRK